MARARARDLPARAGVTRDQDRGSESVARHVAVPPVTIPYYLPAATPLSPACAGAIRATRHLPEVQRTLTTFGADLEIAMTTSVPASTTVL